MVKRVSCDPSTNRSCSCIHQLNVTHFGRFDATPIQSMQWQA